MRRKLASAGHRSASRRDVSSARFPLEQVISEIYAALVNVPAQLVPSDSAPAAVENAFARLLNIFHLDHAVLWEFSRPQSRLVHLAGRRMPGVRKAPPTTEARHLRWAKRKLERGEPIVGSVTDLPRSAADLRRYFDEHGIKSWLALPMRDRDMAFGALIFASARSRTQWANHMTARLQTIADIVAGAFKRSAVEQSLREKESFEASVLSSLPDNVAVLDAHGVILDVNQRWSDFAARTGAPFHSRLRVGDNYVEACRKAIFEREPQAEELRGGVVSALARTTEFFSMQYTCCLERRRRWFQLNVTSIPQPPGGAIVTHTDITAQKEAERTTLELPGRLLRAQEEERSYIARELHDHVNQRLALMSINLEQLGHEMRPQEQSRIEKLRKEAVQISTDVHRLSHRLHPSQLERLGLAAATQEQCREFTEQHRLPVECLVRDILADIDADVAACVFRILEEALHNAAKHSKATKIIVELYAHAEQLCLRVADNGAGFHPAEHASGAGLGLISMRERLRLVRGELSIFSSPSHGTRIEARVPPSRGEELQEQAA